MEINALATKKVISYEDAEEKLREAADPDLISKVKKYKTQINQSRRIPRNRDRQKFTEIAIKRGAENEKEVIRIYENWVNGGKRPKFDISEKATPLDEYPEFILLETKILK